MPSHQLYFTIFYKFTIVELNSNYIKLLAVRKRYTI